MFSPRSSRTRTRSQYCFISWCYNKFMVVSFRPAPAFWGEKLPFAASLLALLEVGRTPFFFSTWRCSRIRGRVHFIPFYTRCVKHPPRGHDNTINTVYPGFGLAVLILGMAMLPLVIPIWTFEDFTVAAGHEHRPYVFHRNESGWRLHHKMWWWFILPVLLTL